MNTTHITPKQSAVLEHILREYRHGRLPSTAELLAHFGDRCRSGMLRNLHALRDAGWLELRGKTPAFCIGLTRKSLQQVFKCTS